MAEKLQAYQGWAGQLHEWRDSMRERYQNWREEYPGNPIEVIKKYVDGPRDVDEDFSHIYRSVGSFAQNPPVSNSKTN